jgi:hypothetical protein
MTTRRQFVLKAIPAALAVAAAGKVSAAAARIDEKDPIAVSLGYKQDATKADAKKFPTYKAGHVCGNCQFFQGKAGEAWGVCPVVGGKLVNAKGWCSAWAKKA